MQSVEVNQSKRNKAMKQIARANRKNEKWFVRFCYGLTWFFRILTVVLGAANILYVIFRSWEAIDLVYLILTVGMPFGLSFLPATVYNLSSSGEYRFRRYEAITFENGGFIYSYRDARTGLSNITLAFHIQYEAITKYQFDEKTKLLTLYGKIIGDVYENSERTASEEYREISLPDVYDFSIKQLLDKNCK